MSLCVYKLLEDHKGNHLSNLQVGLEWSWEDLTEASEKTKLVQLIVVGARGLEYIVRFHVLEVL